MERRDFCAPEGRAAYDAWYEKAAFLREIRRVSFLLAATVAANLFLWRFWQWGYVRLMDAGAFSIPVPKEIVEQLMNLLLYATVFLFPYLVYARLVGLRVGRIPHGRPDPMVTLSCMGLGLGFSLAGSLVSSLIFSFFSAFPLPVRPQMAGQLPRLPAAVALYVVNLVVMPALVEEFAFRGVILSSLRRFGSGFAIVTSSLLFGLMHGNMDQFPFAFVAGLGLGFFFVQTGTIWTGVAVHACNNLIVTILAFYYNQSPHSSAILLTNGLQIGFYLAAALLGFYYMFFRRKASLSLEPSGCPVKTKTVCRNFYLELPMLALLCMMAVTVFSNLHRYR